MYITTYNNTQMPEIRTQHYIIVKYSTMLTAKPRLAECLRLIVTVVWCWFFVSKSSVMHSNHVYTLHTDATSVDVSLDTLVAEISRFIPFISITFYIEFFASEAAFSRLLRKFKMRHFR